jgi:hypothetical protein
VLKLNKGRIVASNDHVDSSLDVFEFVGNFIVLEGFFSWGALFFLVLLLLRCFLFGPDHNPLADPYLELILVFVDHDLILVGLLLLVLLNLQQNILEQVRVETFVDLTADLIPRL